MKKDPPANSAATDEKPPVEQTPAIALEQPSAGGCYVRQADGKLVKQEG